MGATCSAAAIAAHLDLPIVGDDVRLDGVDALDEATADDLAFCVYDDDALVEASDAGAVICPPSIAELEGRTLIYAERPKLAFARAVTAFFETDRTETTVHPTAVVEPDATLGERCAVGPNVYVAGCVSLGDDCIVRAGSVLGTPGFGYERDGDGRLHRVPHRGSVRIEDGVEIGANSSVDRAMFGETVVGTRTKLSGQVHLAHGTQLGRDTTVAFGSGMAGGVTVGDRVTVHPHVAVATDVEVGDDAELGMHATVLDSVPSDTTVVGSPARAVSE